MSTRLHPAPETPIDFINRTLSFPISATEKAIQYDIREPEMYQVILSCLSLAQERLEALADLLDQEGFEIQMSDTILTAKPIKLVKKEILK